MNLHGNWELYKFDVENIGVAYVMFMYVMPDAISVTKRVAMFYGACSVETCRGDVVAECAA